MTKNNQDEIIKFISNNNHLEVKEIIKGLYDKLIKPINEDDVICLNCESTFTLQWYPVITKGEVEDVAICKECNTQYSHSVFIDPSELEDANND